MTSTEELPRTLMDNVVDEVVVREIHCSCDVKNFLRLVAGSTDCLLVIGICL